MKHLTPLTSLAAPGLMPVERSAAVLSERQQATAVGAFDALRCPTRLRIFLTLCGGGRQSVTQLCERVDMAQATISHHLGLLRMSGLVENERVGKQVFYEVVSSVRCAHRPRMDDTGNASGEFAVELTLSDGVTLTLSARAAGTETTACVKPQTIVSPIAYAA